MLSSSKILLGVVCISKLPATRCNHTVFCLENAYIAGKGIKTSFRQREADKTVTGQPGGESFTCVFTCL